MSETEKTKKGREARNKKIEDSIYVSQARESNKGFAFYEAHIACLLKEALYPNVFAIKDEEDRIKAQARAEIYGELIDFLDAADAWALKPKVDIQTGEEEILNKK
jgi:hypothetical protein